MPNTEARRTPDPASLRERQKADRRRRIVAAARAQFLECGYDATTIEQIAAVAEVSPVTIYNHYGTKGGLLLAVVAESDAHLVAKLRRPEVTAVDDPLELALRFSRTINNHAFSYLSRRLWRRVVATAILEAGSEFGRGCAELDRQLVALLARALEALRERGRIRAGQDCAALAEVAYNLHHMRFVQFASDGSMSEALRDELTRRDLTIVFEGVRC
jgi:AcrR family transcriptional regulator